MSLHKEMSFEAEICDYLATHSWFYSERRSLKVSTPRLRSR